MVQRLFVKLQQNSMTYQELKKLGLCTKACGKLAVEGKTRCFECSEQRKGPDTKRRKNRRKNGLCAHCDNLAVEDKSLCFECSEQDNDRHARRYKNRRKNGHCQECGELAVKDKSRCFGCNEQYNKLRNKRHKIKRKNGLCKDCSKLAIEGKSLCFECAYIQTLRSGIRQFCKRVGQNKPCSTKKLLGCDWQTLKNHIENQFQPGMSWNNQGKWHVDHIVPFAAIGIGDITLQQVCHYTNLQPLWARDNLSKGAKYDALTPVLATT